jgi:GntR family phosphonate transport system transcriptional regulator
VQDETRRHRAASCEISMTVVEMRMTGHTVNMVEPADNGLLRWRRIADTIGGDIRARRSMPGAQLEPEAALAVRFGVNRHTVRQAIQHLAHEGLVRIERGRGTFVQDRIVDYPIGERTRFTEIMLAQGLEPAHEIVSAEQGKATSDEAGHLGLRAGRGVARVVTRGVAGGRVITQAQNVFPAARLPGVIALMQQSKSVTTALAAFGHAQYRRAWTRITAELPDPALAAAMGSPQNRPVLVTVALDVAGDGTPLRLGTTAFSGDLCRLVVSAER